MQAKNNGAASWRADPVALVITGRGVTPLQGANQTYLGQTVWLRQSQIGDIKEKRQNHELLGAYWQAKRYSSFESHGADTAHYIQAEGLALNGLLAFAGITAARQKSIDCLTLQAEQSYTAVLDQYGQAARYYFHADGSRGARVEPMLAYRAYCGLTEALDGNHGAMREYHYPMLLFGQRAQREHNHCSYVKEVRKILLGRESEAVALRLYREGGILRTFSIADLLLLGIEERQYPSKNGLHVCRGVDLRKVLEIAAIGQDGALTLDVLINGQVFSGRDPLDPEDIQKGRFLLAFYSQDAANGQPVANDTDLRLYGPNGETANLCGLRLATAVPVIRSAVEKPAGKMPGATEEQIRQACFYIAVCQPQGTVYYYFTPRELGQNYAIQAREYSFDDHTVLKSIRCKGVMPADLLKNLQQADGSPLKIPHNWSIQFVEEDAYHTNIATYINTLAETASLYQPILAFEAMERFVRPNHYHQDQTAYQKVTTPTVFRNAVSANEAVLKGVLGLVVSRDGNGFAPGGYTLIARDAASGEKLAVKQVQGAMRGMRLRVAAPRVTGAMLQAGEPAFKVIEAGEYRKTKVEFLYRQTPFLTINTGDFKSCVQLLATDFKKQSQWFPQSLAEVEALSKTGQALLITIENSCPLSGALSVPLPGRNLYIDGRKALAENRPYGYDQLYLRQYKAIPLRQVLDRLKAKAVHGVGFCCKDGGYFEISGEALQTPGLVLAYQHTESKGVPNNTASGKRKKTTYNAPYLVDTYDGRILAQEVNEIKLL